MVRVCPDAESTRITKYPRRVRPSVLQREDKRFARIILPYLWKETDFWLPLMTHDDEARAQLCYFALTEGCEYMLHDRVTGPLPENMAHWTNPLEPSGDSTLADVRWRSFLIRCMVRAHLMHDTGQSADGAIASFSRIDKAVWAGKIRFREERRLEPNKPYPALTRISILPALMCPNSELLTGRYGRTNSKLWDNFVWRTTESINTRNPRKTIADDFILAGLALHHPSRPNAEPALAFLDKYFLESPEGDLKEIRVSIPASEQVLSLFLSKASSMAHHKSGQAQMAARVAALKIKLLPPDSSRAR
ncbi:hypothetical protein CBER1_10690 [Cercospora berteroae]|uniref:Uncharacterized protein n=1 Tax=Cercospora berteroae TaxID=357750 RepID=A0A2S6CJN7_9PEZI|nr:hypothetical protein CBER1_10690 [Cercospora berteroae]